MVIEHPAPWGINWEIWIISWSQTQKLRKTVCRPMLEQFLIGSFTIQLSNSIFYCLALILYWRLRKRKSETEKKSAFTAGDWYWIRYFYRCWPNSVSSTRCDICKIKWLHVSVPKHILGRVREQKSGGFSILDMDKGTAGFLSVHYYEKTLYGCC